jgi:ribosomal protein S18 acetylase RimI-like enzyme
MTPSRAAEPFDWAGLLALIQRAFKGMEGRIDPPSSLHRLTTEGIAEQARTGEVWVIGDPVAACVFLTVKPGRLYLGKLAVEPAQQGRGYGKALVRLAETRCAALGLPLLELETRVELVENHAVFRKLGFVETGRKAHAGFDRPTSITFAKTLNP